MSVVVGEGVPAQMFTRVLSRATTRGLKSKNRPFQHHHLYFWLQPKISFSDIGHVFTNRFTNKLKKQSSKTFGWKPYLRVHCLFIAPRIHQVTLSQTDGLTNKYINLKSSVLRSSLGVSDIQVSTVYYSFYGDDLSTI